MERQAKTIPSPRRALHHRLNPASLALFAGANAFDLPVKEQSPLGGRYVTRLEVIETLELAARSEIWPIVTDVRPMAEAEALHEAVEKGEIIGRGALRIG